MRKNKLRHLVGAAVVSALALSSQSVGAREIVIGQTMPYSGNASMAATLGKLHAAYFNWVNKNGGVNGHKIRFVSLDDGFSPAKSVEQTRRLVESEKVDLIFSPYGTATTLAVRRYLNTKKIPQLFVVSGVSAWGDPKFPYSIGWMPNYVIETSIHAQIILKNVEKPRIAVLYQNDDFGKEMLAGLRKSLGAKADEMIVATASYESTDPTVNNQVLLLKQSDANVFMNYSFPRFAAQAIRNVYDSGWRPLHILSQTSTSVSQVLVQAGLEKSSGLIAASYNKTGSFGKNVDDWKSDEGLSEYVTWMKENYPEGDIIDTFNSFGYALAKTMHQVLIQCGSDFSADNIMKQARSLNMKIGVMMPGIVVQTASDQPYPVRQMQPIKFDGENWKPWGDLFGAR